MKIAENIKYYRKILRLTQKELAALIYSHGNRIANYENKTRTPDIFTLCKLAKIFDVTLDELVEYDDGEE